MRTKSPGSSVTSSLADRVVEEKLRRLLLAVLSFSTAGSLIDLVLLEHTEDLPQLIPLVLLAASLAAIGLLVVKPSATGIRAFQGLMLLFLVSGVVGLYWHYIANVEFELEMYPTRGGFELFWESLKGATPALAPGVMSALGLTGLVYTFRHPALSPRD